MHQNESLNLHKRAIAQLKVGKLQEGVAILEQALELNPGSGDLHCDIATAVWQMGDATRAGVHFEKALKLGPKRPHIQNNAGYFIMESNNLREAERHLRKAIELKQDYAEAYNNLGLCLHRQNKLDEAEANFIAAIRLKPLWPNPHFNIGSLYHQKRFFARAEAAYKKTIELFPGHVPATFGLAEIMMALGRTTELRPYLDRTIQLDPRYEQAWVALARHHEKMGEFDAAENVVERAEKYIPDSPEIMIVRAAAFLRRGENEKAAEALDKAAKRLAQIRVPDSYMHAEMAQNYDKLGQVEKAIFWAKSASEIDKKNAAQKNLSLDMFITAIDGYRRATKSSSSWRSAPPLPKDLPTPFFLVGFPRSGTTLLDQILSGHPDIVVAEELPGLHNATVCVAADKKKAVWDALVEMDHADIEEARYAYFNTFKEFGVQISPKQVFIDKLPLNLVYTPLIHRLFPDAKFILALRHPCDSVLSCYMQHFMLNEAMIHFSDLEDGARLYNLSFTAWEEAAAAMKFNVHEVRYENVVADLKSEVDRALQFLGLEWKEGMADFDALARARNIRTPSAAQVRQKIYTRAKGRWHKYREFMGNAPEILRPWAEKFGYEMDQ